MERKEYLKKNEKAKKALLSLLAISEDIEGGMSENLACQKNNMDKSYYRRCCDRILQTLDKSNTRKEYSQIEDKPISWKDNFIQKQYGVSYAPLEDFDQAFKFVCDNSTDREKMMLQRYYVEGATIMDIAAEQGVTKQAVSLWLKDLTKKLQNENYKLLFIVGFDFMTKYKERLENTRKEYEEYKRNMMIIEDDNLTIKEKASKLGLDVALDNIEYMHNIGAISNKLYNILTTNNIVNVSDLSNYTMSQLCNFRGFGDKCKKEILELVESKGVTLKK